jgi:hypothetical protein
MYQTKVLDKRFILLLWSILAMLGIIGFIYHERPLNAWSIYFIPAYAVFLIIFFLVNILTNLIHNAIYQIYSIDLSQGKFFDVDKRQDSSVLKSDLEDIFVSPEKFDQYQLKVYQSLISRKTDILAIFCGIIIIGLILFSDRVTTNYVALYGEKPYRVENFEPILLVISVLQFITLSILGVGFMSGLFLLMGFVTSTGKIGLDQETTFQDLSSILQEHSIKVNENEATFEYIRRSELAQFSIKRFRRKCNSIPEAILPINLVLLLVIISTGSIVYYYIILIGEIEILLFLTSVFLVIFTLINIYIFFSPQLALHRIIKMRKRQTIDYLEEHYEIKKYQWLSLPSDTSFENKQSLYNEIRVLANFIEEIEHLLTWPFDYKQFITILASGLLTILLLIDILDFVSLVEDVVPK